MQYNDYLRKVSLTSSVFGLNFLLMDKKLSFQFCCFLSDQKDMSFLFSSTPDFLSSPSLVLPNRVMIFCTVIGC